MASVSPLSRASPVARSTAHRQLLPGDTPDERVGFFGAQAVGGVGLSISRTIYSLLWLGNGDKRSSDEGSSSSGSNRGNSHDGSSDAAAAPDEEGGLDPSLRALYHAAVFAFSMTFERAALVFGGAVVPAIVGRNYFFPHKPGTLLTSYFLPPYFLLLFLPA